MKPACRSPASIQSHSMCFLASNSGKRAILGSSIWPRATKLATSSGSRPAPSVSMMSYTNATGPNGQRMSSGRARGFRVRPKRSRQSCSDAA